MTSTRKQPAGYGPVQLADRLGLAVWQLERALALGVIPTADLPARRWSAACVDDLRGRIAQIRARVGTVPDLGAHRAADVLSRRLGITVTADAVAELARIGAITEAGDYKGHPLYSGLDLEAFTDHQAAARAAHTGRLRTADEAAAYLQIRRSDFARLARARWITPAGYGPSAWSRRPHVPLYRTGDLDVLLHHPAIDWDAVRATPKGRPSPLARLTTTAGRS